MTTSKRTAAIAVLVLLATALAGCSAAVTPPERVHAAPAAGYDVADTHVWTAGSTTEYRSKLVVTGVLEHAAEPVASVPEVVVRFRLASGETRTVQARYTVDRRLTAYDDLGNETLAQGESIPVRAIFDPADAATVENATVVVRG